MLGDQGVNLSASSSRNLPLKDTDVVAGSKPCLSSPPQPAHPPPQPEDPRSVEGSRKKQKITHHQIQEDTNLSQGWIEGFSMVDEFMVI